MKKARVEKVSEDIEQIEEVYAEEKEAERVFARERKEAEAERAKEIGEVKKIAKAKKRKSEQEETKKEKEEKREESKGKAGKNEETKVGVKMLIFALVVILMVGGVFGGLKMTLGGEETVVATEENDGGVWVVGKTEGKMLEKFCLYSFLAQDLFKYGFREMEGEEILSRLNELKDGFAGVTKEAEEVLTKTTSVEEGMNVGSGAGEVAEIVKNDTANYLTKVRNLRQVMTSKYPTEADRQAEFLKAVDKKTGEMRSAVYMSRYAFKGDAGNLMLKSGAVFGGRIVAEVGGGVMNVFVGSYKDGSVGVSSEDYKEDVKTLAGAHELVVTGEGEMVRVGESVKGELELGKGMMVKIEKGENEGDSEAFDDAEMTVKRVKLGMLFRNVFGVDEIFAEQGVKNFVKKENMKDGKEGVRGLIKEMREVVK